jgi:regulator of replication initiation timing
MLRALGTALLCALAVVVADTLFRTSLLSQLRPVILSPADRAVVQPPVQVRWDGPQQMQVFLAATGEELRDLGLQESPFEIGADHLTRAGGYRLELRSPSFGTWISADRRFQVHGGREAPEVDGSAATASDIRDLFVRALAAARDARDTARARAKYLKEENVGLRAESDRLNQQLETFHEDQEEDAAEIADLERRLAQFAEESRVLGEENAALRLRLSSVIPCTVWGYYNYPRPNTIPVTRRGLVVSDTRGQIFRTQADCEIIRRADATADTYCFCVGNSWGQ